MYYSSARVLPRYRSVERGSLTRRHARRPEKPNRSQIHPTAARRWAGLISFFGGVP